MVEQRVTHTLVMDDEAVINCFCFSCSYNELDILSLSLGTMECLQ